MAVTVSTSGYSAGDEVMKLAFSLPAATTTLMPALVAAQMAVRCPSVVVAHVWPFSAGPPPPRLMEIT
jgi:hypothetical protein